MPKSASAETGAATYGRGLVWGMALVPVAVAVTSGSACVKHKAVATKGVTTRRPRCMLHLVEDLKIVRE